MKTTDDKKKVSRRPKRSIRIHSMPSGNRVEVRYGSSLKQALENYFKDRLKPKGYKKVSCVGNILLVSDGEETHEFVAYEELSWAQQKAK